MKQEYYFSMALTYAEFLPYYQGKVEFIQVITTKGLSIRFPAMHLRNFITRAGIYGQFLLITENNKFKSLLKIT
ncbi:MAG: DUF2835 domain-containing protein [Thalassotalea sp.]